MPVRRKIIIFANDAQQEFFIEFSLHMKIKKTANCFQSAVLNFVSLTGLC